MWVLLVSYTKYLLELLLFVNSLEKNVVFAHLKSKMRNLFVNKCDVITKFLQSMV